MRKLVRGDVILKENYSKVELNLISIENIISNKNLDFNYRVEKGLELLEDVKILKKVRRELYILLSYT